MMVPLLIAATLQAAAQTPSVQVVVEPATVEVEVGATVQLSAAVRAADGRVLSEARLRWFTAANDIIELDQQGLVRGLQPGSAEVRVVALGVEGAVPGVARIRVPALPPTALRMDVPSRDLWVGTSAPIGLRGTDAQGAATTAFRAEYRSSDASVARVDAMGRVHAVGPGEASLSARVGSVQASARVRVEDPGELSFELMRPATSESLRTGDVLRLSVTASNGREQRTVYPAWSVSGGPALIDTDDHEGVFVAEEAGSYIVTAVIGDAGIASAAVEVEARTSEETLVQVGRGGIATHHSGDMWVFEGVDGRDYVYVGTFMHDWMKVWDVTDPAAPFLTDSLQLDARRINDVKIHPNNRLGIVTREGASNRRNGIVFLDLSTPAHPTVISHYEETVTGGVHNVWVDEDNELLYAVHNGTSDIHILDISDPAAATEVGTWGLDKTGKTLHDVIVQDGYAFLSYWDDGVIILDVGAGTHEGTPRDPTFVSQYKYPIGNTHVAWRSGDYLFLGDEIFPDGWDADRPIEADGYIHVVDVSDIDNPHEVAFYRVPEAGAHNVWVEDDKLYVGYYQAGLRVVDISGELRGDLYAQGREIAKFRTTDSETTVPNWPMAWGAQIFKGRIYSSDLNSGIWITKLQPRSRLVS